MAIIREYTNRILDAVEEGSLDKDYIIQTLLHWMDESEVKECALDHGLTVFGEDDEEDQS